MLVCDRVRAWTEPSSFDDSYLYIHRDVETTMYRICNVQIAFRETMVPLPCSVIVIGNFIHITILFFFLCLAFSFAFFFYFGYKNDGGWWWAGGRGGLEEREEGTRTTATRIEKSVMRREPFHRAALCFNQFSSNTANLFLFFPLFFCVQPDIN